MNDVRDEALAALLDREATRIESAPVDRLPEVLRRGSQRRAIRFTAIAAAVAIFAGAVSWAGLQNEGRETIPANIDDWDTFASLEENGWTVQVPSSWRVHELPACSNAPERIGVIVSNVDFEFLNRDGVAPACAEGFVFDGFPTSGVAFAFVPWRSTDGLLIRRPDTVLPLSLDLLTEVRRNADGLTRRSEYVWLGSPFGVVRRWTGPEASVPDVAALDRMLASFNIRSAPRWVEAVASTSELRVAVTHPGGWDVSRFGRMAIIDAPQPILMVTSPGVREGYSRCLGGPFREFKSLGTSGVVVVISDATDSWGAGSISQPRPPALRPSGARYDDIVRCSGEVRRLTFQFEEAGRPISVYVLITTAHLREQPEVLWHILDSIRIEAA